MSEIKRNIVLIVIVLFMLLSCDSVRDKMGASASALSGDEYGSQSNSLSNFNDSSQ